MPDFYLLASWLFLLCALATSWLAGDRRDRRIVEAIGLVSLSCAVAYAFLNTAEALLANVILDSVILVLVTRYAVRAAKYWPIWFAGFHCVTVMFEIASLLLHGEPQMVAWRLGAFWFLPACGAMVVGLLIDRKRGLGNIAQS